MFKQEPCRSFRHREPQSLKPLLIIVHQTGNKNLQWNMERCVLLHRKKSDILSTPFYKNKRYKNNETEICKNKQI